MRDARFAQRMRELLDARAVSYRALAARTFHSKSYLHDLATGKKHPTPEAARRIDDALGAGGELLAYVNDAPVDANPDQIDVAELAHRVAVSDVSPERLERLERAVDDLAVAYPSTPPELLLPRVRFHMSYVGRLVDGRKTLDQHRRLLIAGAWLALLGATVHIDLEQRRAAQAHLEASRRMAAEAGHDEIVAWCLETRAWDVLTAGDFPKALDLSRQAQAVAPRGSSAFIQATAQEGRAWARMGQPAETRDALRRTERLVSGLPMPDRPEHHYQYDPSKALAYVATTLAWAGDPAAESQARSIVDHLDGGSNAVARPRRAASARLDLGLALLAASKPDEASTVTLAAITSGRMVPSNWWRVAEVVSGVKRSGASEAVDLLEACRAYHPARRSG